MVLVPSVTIVLELDNYAHNRDELLLEESLASISTSIKHYSGYAPLPDINMVVVVDEVPIVREICDNFSRAVSARYLSNLRIYVAPGSTYYEKKMLGARKSNTDYIIFVDSDVIYDETWFSILYGCISENKPDVVYGETYALEGSGLENSLAVAWQFPFYGISDSRRNGAPHRWSNNWAVRTELLMAHPLPRISGNLKAEGTLWDHYVISSGRAIEACAAIAYHRQPSGLLEWWNLAVRSGRAKVVRGAERNQKRRTEAIALLSARYFRNLMARVPTISAQVNGPSFSVLGALTFGIVRHLGMKVGFGLEILQRKRGISYDYSNLTIQQVAREQSIPGSD